MKKKIILTKAMPNLDNYEPPAEYPFDPAKMERNRFATHGGKRPGSGRKAAAAPIVRKTITLTQPQVAYLHRLDANLSRAIRKLIDAAK